jgi:hypothetical protein
MNPLTSVKGSLITGFVLAILFAVFAVDGGWNELGLARWLHIIAGITWIGLLSSRKLPRTRAAQAAPASRSTSRRARSCGFAGRRSSRG